MQDQAFWAIIAAARATAGDEMEARVAALTQQLQDLSPETIQAFQNKYDEFINRTDRWDLWGAAYLMNGGCSDDGFRYFRDWLISEGEPTWTAALANPDSLAAVPAQDYFELESFGYAAMRVYEAKTGQELGRDENAMFGFRPTQGEEWEEDDLPTMFPQLAEKYA